MTKSLCESILSSFPFAKTINVVFPELWKVSKPSPFLRFLYIRTIAHIVRRDGIWTNIGPLLYHYADVPHEISIELSWEEVRPYICKYFDILEEEHKVAWCFFYFYFWILFFGAGLLSSVEMSHSTVSSFPFSFAIKITPKKREFTSAGPVNSWLFNQPPRSRTPIRNKGLIRPY